MTEPAILALLGIVASLVGALTWQNKNTSRRLDLRETQLQESLDTLKQAVDAFRGKERAQDRILMRLDKHEETQLAILNAINKLADKLGTKAT